MYFLNALTGDQPNTILYIIIAVAVIGMLGLTVVPKLAKKKNKDNVDKSKKD